MGGKRILQAALLLIGVAAFLWLAVGPFISLPGAPSGVPPVFAVHTPTATPTQPTGNEGCTPGFWKNHTSAWVGYTPGQTVESVFNVPDAFGLDNDTLLEALSYPGGPGLAGGAQILLRAAVAALLNAANPNVDYPVSEASIISNVNSRLNGGSRSNMLTLAAQLDTWNNLGAPPFCD